MLTVLVAAVMLTIIGVNFARKISNKAMVSKAADIIAYRDMLLEYYTSLAANRAAYKCTRTNNSAPTTSFTDIDLYDIGSGTNCTTAHKVIPIAGRDMKPWDDVAATTTIACANNNGQYICLQAQWKKTGTVVELKISAVFDHDDFAHSDVSAVLRDRTRSIFFGSTTVGTSCGNISGFTGNKPLVALKSYPSPQINCGTDTLVVPPNYPNIPAACPDTAQGGKRGIIGFDPITGVSNCSNKILAWVKLNASGDCSNLSASPETAFAPSIMEDQWTGYNARFGVSQIAPTGAITCSGTCEVNNANRKPGTTRYGSCGYSISTADQCDITDTLTQVCHTPGTTNDDAFCTDGDCECCNVRAATTSDYNRIPPLPWAGGCMTCDKDAQRAAIEPNACSPSGGITGWDGANSHTPEGLPKCEPITRGEQGLQGRTLCQLSYQYKYEVGRCERNYSCTYDTINGCSTGGCGCHSDEYCSSSTSKCRKSGERCKIGYHAGDQSCSPGYGCVDKSEAISYCPGSPTNCRQWSQ